MAETTNNFKIVSAEPLPIPPKSLDAGVVLKFFADLVTYIRRMRDKMIESTINYVINITNNGLLPEGTGPSVLVKQDSATVWTPLNVPDSTKDYILVYDHSATAGSRVKWVEATTTFVCP